MMFDDYEKKYTKDEIEDQLLKYIDRIGTIGTDEDVQDFIEKLK